MRVFPTFDKKFLYRWVAVTAIICNLLPVLYGLCQYYREKVIVPRMIRNSYIAEIKGDLMDVELAKKHLDIFNNYGHNRIVNRTGTRPITIEIRELGKGVYEILNKDRILAYTESKDDSCKIILTNDMKTEIEFRDTLLHELLHCFEYDHVASKKDLMYWQENGADKLPSIKKYAEEVENRVYD